MDPFKIDIFSKENPGRKLPMSTLPDADSRKMCNAFLELISYPQTTTTQQLFSGIENSDRQKIVNLLP